jgi:hypothetical protein
MDLIEVRKQKEIVEKITMKWYASKEIPALG